MTRRALIIISSVLLVGLAGMGGCTRSTTETSPAPPFTTEVSFPHGAPPLNQTAELVCAVSADSINVRNMSLEISLPEGFELVSGDLSWTGDITKGSKIEVVKAIIRSINTGNWAIEITGYLNPEENGGIGMSGSGPICYVSVSEDSAEWGKYPPWGKEGGYPVPVQRDNTP